MPEPIYELSDVEVDTLGLVTRGANREEFFLLKAEDAVPVTPEVETATQNIWQRLLATIKKALTEPSFNDMPVATEPVAEVTAEIVTKDTTNIVTTIPGDVQVVYNQETPIESNVDKQETTPVTNIPTVSQPETREVPMTEEFNTVAKADFDAITVRLEKAEAELVKANEEKERGAWLQKAQTYSYMPVSSSELAEQLHWLAKAATTRAEWWMTVLKACDNMIHDSGLFVEKGTTIEAEDAVSKVLKSADPRTAALNLPRAEAEAYLRTVRQGGR